MNDNALFTLVRTVILAGLQARGMAGWKVARRFQPTHQGGNMAPTVYLFKIADRRHGSPERKYEWNEAGQVIESAEEQQYETTFQASADVDETTDPAALTPSDACNVVAAIMQSDDALAALRAQEVGILRIGEIRNPYNVNDHDRYEASPSFDFVLTHRRGTQGTVPAVVTVEPSVNRV